MRDAQEKRIKELKTLFRFVFYTDLIKRKIKQQQKRVFL